MLDTKSYKRSSIVTCHLSFSLHRCNMTTAKLNVGKKFHETINDFVSRKIKAACLISSALLVHRSKVGGVVEGYLINDKMKYYVRHYWCCIDEQDYDVGTVINMILMPEVLRKLGKRRLSQTPPDGYKYISIMNPHELKKLEDGYSLYSNNPKMFWKNSPGWIQKIIRSEKD